MLKILNGESEPYMDCISTLKQKYPENDYKNGLTTNQIFNIAEQNSFYQKEKIDSFKYNHLNSCTTSDFVSFIQKTRSDLYYHDLNNFKNKISPIYEKILKGVQDCHDFKEVIKKKNDDIYNLKKTIEKNHKETTKMRLEMMKDIIHLRENQFKLTRGESIIRAEYFDISRYVDEATSVFLQEKLSSLKKDHQDEVERL